MARDPREAAAAVAQQTAAEVLGGDDDADERPRSRAAPQAARNSARRMDPGDAVMDVLKRVARNFNGKPAARVESVRMTLEADARARASRDQARRARDDDS